MGGEELGGGVGGRMVGWGRVEGEGGFGEGEVVGVGVGVRFCVGFAGAGARLWRGSC